jgi:ABC-type multidrug transport system ATPase subunit
LDAYNAYNVIECLVTLARDFNRTVVFTIHQPRSNIAALFDQLILLAEGKMVYSGPFSKCQEYFDHIGHPCPPGFNIADYLVDLTMHASRIETPPTATPSESGDSEAGFPVADASRPARGRKNSIRALQEHQLYDPRPRSNGSDGSNPSLRDDFGTTQQWASIAEQTNIARLDPQSQNGSKKRRSRSHRQRQTAEGETERLHAAEHLATLVYSYENSAISDQIREEIYDAVNTDDDNDSLPEELPQSKRIGWLGQFVILSKRTFKNLYRNPMLLLTHYTIAILMARIVLRDKSNCSDVRVSILRN